MLPRFHCGAGGRTVPDMDIFEHLRVAMCECGILHIGTNFQCQP